MRRALPGANNRTHAPTDDNIKKDHRSARPILHTRSRTDPKKKAPGEMRPT